MSRRGITVLGLALAGGAGYYLYSAGGDPKVAQKKLEADASKASAKVKSELPGKKEEWEKKGHELTDRASKDFDKFSADAKSRVGEAEAKAREFKEKTGKDFNAAVDNFDKTVERKTSEAKSGISGWFGGSK